LGLDMASFSRWRRCIAQRWVVVGAAVWTG
jgi:hypothetical protein